MDREQLQARFPQLKPISGPPSLVTVNGIGLVVYGARDHDGETGTFVKTRCLAVFFVPVLALDAYRVAKAQGGWYFLGKEPLSVVARAWNTLVALLLASAIALPQWEAYTTSPDYLARQELERAQGELAAGRLTPATHHLAAVAGGDTAATADAQALLHTIVAEQLPSAPPDVAVEVLASVVKLRMAARHAVAEDAALVAFARTMIARTDDPRHGLAALEAVAALLKPEEMAAFKETLLVALVAKEPGDVQAASTLAEIWDGRGDHERCFVLLAPLGVRLATHEGARILGQIYANRGMVQESWQLLFPYCRERLKTLQSIEQRYRTQEERAWKAAFAALNDGAAGKPWYRAYDGMDKEHQRASADAWAQERVRHDTIFLGAQEALRQAATVVPVALDLGVVTLQRAQTLVDPAARKAELEAAEKTFLAIKGLAGDSDGYHLSFGQVCFWLGKQEAGRKEFDALLAKHQRANVMLLSIANTMREIGATDECRHLSEEAYGKAKNDQERYAAARLRALPFIDGDDQLRWLERCDPGDARVTCDLHHSRGNKAIRDGDVPKAITELRACIASYQGMPRSASTLNNGALAAHDLFSVTGDRSDLDHGNRWLEEAVALDPGNSILMENVAMHLLQAAVMEVIGTRIDQVALHRSGSMDLLDNCYRDQAGRNEVVAHLNAHASLVRALGYFEKLLVLAPKNEGIYAALGAIHRFTGNGAALRALQLRLRAAQLDPLRDREKYADARAGKDDEREHGYSVQRIHQLEELLASKTLPRPSPTGAAATTRLVECRLGLLAHGEQIDGDALIALAEQAEAEAPSADSLDTLITTLVSCALHRVAAATPGLAELMAEHRRSLSDASLAVIACGDPRFSAPLAADPALRRAVVLMKERLHALPDTANSGNWALLQGLGDPAAATFASAIRQGEATTLAMQLYQELAPLGSDQVIGLWWRLRALGDADGAHRLAIEARARDVPLPAVVQ
jgi:hypothetical protein